MKNYYEWLEIDKDADKPVIKRAYFTKVRQYPPERYPEEFKQIRAAYETLSDNDKRAEYDRESSLPTGAKVWLSHARLALKQGRRSDAIETLLLIIKQYPSLIIVRIELARVYEDMEKWGKVIEVWESICGMEPDNSEYAWELAVAYDERSWNRKAIKQYQKAIALDPGNFKAWYDLITCRLASDGINAGFEVFAQATAEMAKAGLEDIRLYAKGIVMCLEAGDSSKGEIYCQKLIELIKSNKSLPIEDCEFVINELMEYTMDNKDPFLLPYIRKMMRFQSNIDKDLIENINKAEDRLLVYKLDEEGCPAVILSLIVHKMEDSGSEHAQIEQIALECSILMDISGYRPHIARLEKNYPRLYALHKDFFREVTQNYNLEKLLFKHMGSLSMKGIMPKLYKADGSFVDPDEMRNPVKRESPKIGRNEFCPCGSGKKYKRCCGA